MGKIKFSKHGSIGDWTERHTSRAKHYHTTKHIKYYIHFVLFKETMSNESFKFKYLKCIWIDAVLKANEISKKSITIQLVFKMRVFFCICCKMQTKLEKKDVYQSEI